MTETPPTAPTGASFHPVILFDGVCNLCNGFVQFVIRRDRHDIFRFGSLQSEEAQRLLARSPEKPADLTTIVLLQGDAIDVESDAILKIAKRLPGGWKLLSVCIILPRFLRDGVYRFISKHRYRIFGRRDSCMVPTLELRGKFIGSD